MTGATTGSMTGERQTIVGVFDSPSHAERALNGLQTAGFTPEQVSVVAKDAGDSRQMAESSDTVAEDATGGAASGAVLGGLGGFLLGVSALAIPGIGPIVGGGILLSTVAGAGIGAAAGGLVGALVGHGLPETDARGYEEHVRRGSVLLTVHATSGEQARKARALCEQAGAADARSYQAPM